MNETDRHEHTQTLIERHFSSHFQEMMIAEAALVGVVAGLIVTGYRVWLKFAESFLHYVSDAAATNPLVILTWSLLLIMLMVVVGKLMLWEPYTQGSGMPQVDAEVMGKISAPWKRIIPAKFVEGALGAIGGLSLGRTGESVQIGAMSGKAVSEHLKCDRGEQRLLITCGAAAGMAAAFRAPLTGTLFAIEEIHKKFTPALIITTMTSAVISAFISTQAMGVEPLVSIEFFDTIPHFDYALLILMGVIFGMLGALHNIGMFYIQKANAQIQKMLPYSRLILPFALAGIATFCAPQLTGGGDKLISVLLAPGHKQIQFLIFLLIAKYIITSVCFGSSAPGGTLFPLIAMGMTAGAIYSLILIKIGIIPSEYYINFIVLGMAGLFAGAIRAPMTAIVLTFELTGSLNALISVSIVVILSYVTANLLHIEPFFEYLLNRYLRIISRDDNMKLTHHTLSDLEFTRYIVSPGSKADRTRVCDLKLPDKVRIVLIRRNNMDIMVNGMTILEPLDELIVIEEACAEANVDVIMRSLVTGTSIDARMNQNSDREGASDSKTTNNSN